MSKLQKAVVMTLAVALLAGGSTVLAKGKKNHDSQQGGLTPGAANTGAPQTGKKKTHHPHGIVKEVSDGSITIEKVKKHKTKTFKVSSNVVVKKKAHGKKHGKTAGTSAIFADVKVGDHVRLTLENKQVVRVYDKGKGHKKHKKATKPAAGLGKRT